MKRMKVGAAVVLACLLVAGSSSAVVIPPTQAWLSDLAALGGSVSIGDKVFSDFKYLATGDVTVNPAQILVTASIEDGVYYLTWGGQIVLGSAGSAFGDLLLNYTVTANPGKITMIDQEYTGSAQGNGVQFLAIDETVKAGDAVVGFSHLQADDLSDPFAETGDNLYVNPPQSTLKVTKDIGMGIIGGGFITISEVKQSFHQIPDGGMTVGLLGLAMMGLAGLRRMFS